MIKNEKNKEFFKAGENVGNIIGTVVEVSPSLVLMKSKVMDIALVVKGIVLGFGNNESLNFSECVHDGTLDFKDFEEAIQKIEAKNVREVLDGIKALA